MEFEQLISSITPEIYERLKRAVELGKWDNGIALTSEQREQCMQAVIIYDQRFHQEASRIGQLEQTPHTPCEEDEQENSADEWQKLDIK